MDVRSSTTEVRITSGITAAIGVWEVIAPFVLGYVVLSPAPGNDIIIGLTIAALGAARAISGDHQTWLSWGHVVVGLWLIAAPFILGYSNIAAATVNDIIVGLVVSALGLVSVYVTRQPEQE
ncbi:MAG: SPW repeat protein [Chloroflexota bacterium]